MTANQVPSTISSIAAAAALRADMILSWGIDIEPDVSTMMHLGGVLLTGPAAPASAHVTVTIAWTSVALGGEVLVLEDLVVQSAIG